MTALRTELARQIADLRSLDEVDEVVRIRAFGAPITPEEREEVAAVRKRLAGRGTGRAAA